MKLFISLIILFTVVSSNATDNVLVCSSEDFKPAEYVGQALKLTLDSNHKVLIVEKVEGSWFGDTGIVTNPKVISESTEQSVYDINFDNDEYYGHLTVPAAATIDSVIYEFSYPDDEQDRVSIKKLYCE